MAEGSGDADKLGVFISYSRDDLAFADQLDAVLRIGGFESAIDRHGIHAGEQWEPRLGALIRNADTVVFVLTPSSAKSKICEWEVAEARRLGKRIMPVVPGPLGDAQAPPSLAALNYIFFYNEPKKPGSSFGTGLLNLVEGLKKIWNGCVSIRGSCSGRSSGRPAAGRRTGCFLAATSPMPRPGLLAAQRMPRRRQPCTSTSSSRAKYGRLRGRARRAYGSRSASGWCRRRRRPRRSATRRRGAWCVTRWRGSLQPFF